MIVSLIVSSRLHTTTNSGIVIHYTNQDNAGRNRWTRTSLRERHKYSPTIHYERNPARFNFSCGADTALVANVNGKQWQTCVTLVPNTPILTKNTIRPQPCRFRYSCGADNALVANVNGKQWQAHVRRWFQSQYSPGSTSNLYSSRNCRVFCNSVFFFLAGCSVSLAGGPRLTSHLSIFLYQLCCCYLTC